MKSSSLFKSPAPLILLRLAHLFNLGVIIMTLVLLADLMMLDIRLLGETHSPSLVLGLLLVNTLFTFGLDRKIRTEIARQTSKP